VRRGKGKGSIDFLGLAARRRRDRLLVVVMALVCTLVAGYVFVEAQQARTRSVREPAPPSRPPVIDAIGAGSVGRSDAEAASETAQTASPSAPEESCDDLKVLVDQSHSLPPDYVPEDLAPLWAYGVPTLGGGEMFLRREAAGHLRLLVEDAWADGEELVVASAYRSYAHQQVSHARLASIYGAGAEKMSATPGHSQHQLGTAVDFTNAAAGYEVWRAFGDTTAYYWLRENAPQYGFVLAYPDGKETETGYRWEPWHYRYVGPRNAERLEESGLSLQEFLTREGVLPRC
jgi:zinc D-Ala-D-Ala carboxypeptidase